MRSILGLERGKKRKVTQNVVLPSESTFLPLAVLRWALICGGNALGYQKNVVIISRKPSN